MHPSPPPPPPPHPPPHCLTDEKPATTKPEFTAFCSCSSPQQTGLTSAHATSRLLFLIHDFNTTKLNWNVNTAKCRYATLVELRGLRVSFLLFHCSVWFYVYSCINDFFFFLAHTVVSLHHDVLFSGTVSSSCMSETLVGMLLPPCGVTLHITVVPFEPTAFTVRV